MNKPYLSRKNASELLRNHGFDVSPATLAKMACGHSSDAGPPMYRFGRFPLYDEEETLNWARSRVIRAKGSQTHQDQQTGEGVLHG